MAENTYIPPDDSQDAKDKPRSNARRVYLPALRIRLRSVLPAWIKSLAGLGLFAWAVGMIQIAEFALAQLLFLLSAVAFLGQIYYLEVQGKRGLVKAIRGFLVLALIVAFVLATVINFKIKGTKAWSNLWAEETQSAPIVQPQPGPGLSSPTSATPPSPTSATSPSPPSATSSPLQAPLFYARVEAIAQYQSWPVVYVRIPNVLFPVNVLMLVEIVNNRQTLTKIRSYTVSINVDRRWIRLPRLEAAPLNFYLATDHTLKRCLQLDFSKNGFDFLAKIKTLQPGESVRGWMFFEWPHEFPDKMPPFKQIQIQIENTQGETTTLVVDVPSGSSVIESGELFQFAPQKDVTDFSGWELRPPIAP